MNDGDKKGVKRAPRRLWTHRRNRKEKERRVIDVSELLKASC